MTAEDSGASRVNHFQTDKQRQLQEYDFLINSRHCCRLWGLTGTRMGNVANGAINYF